MQAVVAAQRLQIVGTPVLVEVLTRACGVGVGDVDQPQRGGVLEEHREGVAPFEQGPVVEAGVAEAAVLRVADVQLPDAALVDHAVSDPSLPQTTDRRRWWRT
jgi:hypothetical protein